MDMERRATMVKDLTAGQVVPLLLRFALPLFVSNALQAVYNVVDMVVVGNYIGKAGMSAVSSPGPWANSGPRTYRRPSAPCSASCCRCRRASPSFAFC